MKEYDRVMLIVEKEKYANEGVHKGMDGWICDPRNIDGHWLVCFDQYGALPNIATIPVKEEDLEIVWEAHIRQVGDKVLLLTEKYQNIGLRKGFNGVLRVKEKDNKWVVYFERQGEMKQDVSLIVDGNDIILDD